MHVVAREKYISPSMFISRPFEFIFSRRMSYSALCGVMAVPDSFSSLEGLVEATKLCARVGTHIMQYKLKIKV